MDLETRVALLEAKMSEIVGNGRPGKLDKLETQIQDMQKTLVRVMSVVCLIAGTTGGGVAAVVQALFGGG